MKRLFILMAFCAAPLLAQTSYTGRIVSGPAASRPTCNSSLIFNGNANPGDIYNDTDDTGVFKCMAGTWSSFGGGGGTVYPGAGIAVSNGSSWLTSYQVGTAANNIVQLDGSARLPAVSAALLTNFPTFNQNTSGTSGGLLGCTPISNGSFCIWNGSAWTLFAGNTSGTKVHTEDASGNSTWAVSGAGVPTETQFCGPYYATTTTFGCLTSPAVPGVYTYSWAPPTAAAVAPTAAQVGFVANEITGSQTTLTGGITALLVGQEIVHDRSASGTVNLSIPTPTTLNNPNFAFFYSNKSAQTDTLTPVTYTIDGSSTKTFAQGSACKIYVNQNSASDWLSDCNTASAGTVNSVFGRTGVVVAADSDYTAAQIAVGALKNGVTATTQATDDASNDVTTNKYVDLLMLTPSSMIRFDESFCGGMTSEGLVGTYGWFTDLPSPAFISRTAAAAPDRNHPCGLQWSTGSTSGNYAATYLQYCNQGSTGTACSGGGVLPAANVFGPLNASTFDSWFVIKPTAISTSVGTKMIEGFFDWVGGNPTGVNGITIRYSKVSGDTNYTGVTCASSTCTATSLGVAPVQGDWTVMHIFSTVAGTIQMGVCNSVPPAVCKPGSTQSFSTNIPTLAMTPIFDIENEATNAVRSAIFERFIFSQLPQ